MNMTYTFMNCFFFSYLEDVFIFFIIRFIILLTLFYHEIVDKILFVVQIEFCDEIIAIVFFSYPFHSMRNRKISIYFV